MHIIIPMSGFGERFRTAGYTVPKPLIVIDGKPLIAHVCELFPTNAKISFLCNSEHLQDPALNLRTLLSALRPQASIIEVPNLRQGPIGALLHAQDIILPDEPVVVNYCDFTCLWSWTAFEQFVSTSGCAGAIPAYRGFHPHSLGSTMYAYLKMAHGRVVDIQEKTPFTKTPMQELASTGTYYMASGALLLEACRAVMDQGLTIRGEGYVSLAYLPLMRQGLDIRAYEIHRFMQWGTPEDLADYTQWSKAFERLTQPPPKPLPGRLLLPIAGVGQRFESAGYTTPKPLLPISGQPMAQQAAHLLPHLAPPRIVLRKDSLDTDVLATAFLQQYPQAEIVWLDGPTQGQAMTCLSGINGLDDHIPITVAACDTGILHNTDHLRALLDDPQVDVIIWTMRGHRPAQRRPHQYGWVKLDEQHRVTGVSVKTPLEAPDHDPIITGAFTFKRPSDLRRAIDRLVARDGRINGEFYLDSCIDDALALGLSVRIHPIDHYLCWGTPDEYKTFQYWQSTLHTWSSHPYTLQQDMMVDPKDQDHVRAHLAIPTDAPCLDS